MSKLKPLLLAADQGACAYHRVHEPARVARAVGVAVETEDDGLPVDATQTGSRIKIHDMSREWNLLVFQRPTLAAIVEAIKFAQSVGIACAVELDDDLSSVHPQNIAYSAYNGATHESWANTVEACNLADVVITTTNTLAQRFAKHGRFAIIPNYVAESTLQPAKDFEDAGPLGWTGTVQTHPEDLDVAGAHAGTVINNSVQGFAVVGDATGVKQKLYLSDKTNISETGWIPREEYISAVRANIGIGIVPLKLDAFNQSKSWLKGLEYASQGIPFVASPTEAYQNLNALGAGLLAHKGKDWLKHLKRLSSDAVYYRDQAQAVAAVATELTYEKHADKWIAAWTRAVEHRNSCS